MRQFVQTANLPRSLRRTYLASLSEPQEWFLEELVRSGEVWQVPGKAYAVFHGDTLVEFFAVDAAEASRYLIDLIKKRPFEKGLCKSFDHALKDAAVALGWGLLETAFLFRKRSPVFLVKPETFQLVRASMRDLADVWETGRDFYDSDTEVAQILRAGGLWIAFNDGQVVGSGIMIPIGCTGDVVDIGIVTRSQQRRQGFGSLIAAELADILEADGKRPICGCAQRNLGSKGALENAGFISEHRLVQISVTN